MTDFAEIWSYLAQGPLLWLTLTLAAYVAGDALSRRLERHPLANPVLVAGALIVAVLLVTGTGYAEYFEGAQFVHFLLGPATVALAVPLWKNRALVRANLLPMAMALAAGSLAAAASAVPAARQRIGPGLPCPIPLPIGWFPRPLEREASELDRGWSRSAAGALPRRTPAEPQVEAVQRQESGGAP